MNNTLPEVTEVTPIAGGVQLKIYIDKEIKYFKGHFEKFSLLPGVVQIHWAVMLAKTYLKVDGAFSGLDGVKFSAPIVPGTRMILELHFDP